MDKHAKVDYCYVAMADSSDVINWWNYSVPISSAIGIIGANIATVVTCVDLKAKSLNTTDC